MFIAFWILVVLGLVLLIFAARILYIPLGKFITKQADKMSETVNYEEKKEDKFKLEEDKTDNE